MTLNICILTPGSRFWEGDAEEIILPTSTGQMGVKKNHAPLITALECGIVLIRIKDSWVSGAGVSRAVVMGGFAVIQKNKVIVLVNEGFSPGMIDFDQAEKEYTKALTKWEESVRLGQKQKLEATFAMKKAKLRYKLAQLEKSSPSAQIEEKLSKNK